MEVSEERKPTLSKHSNHIWTRYSSTRSHAAASEQIYSLTPHRMVMMARGPWEGRRRPSLLCAASLAALSLLPAAAPLVPQLRLCSQLRNETCLPRLFRLAQRCSPASLLDLHSHTRSSVSLTRSRSFGCRSLTLGRSLTSVRSTASVSRNDTCLLQHPFAALPLLCRASPGIGDLYL